MTKGEVHAYLDSKPGWMVLTTLDRDGFPHSVPLGYFRRGDEILLGTVNRTRKVWNAKRNPKVSLLVESGDQMSNLKGVMIQGHATVLDTPEQVLEASRAGARARGVAEADLPTEPSKRAAYIRVVPERIVSWDYSDSGSG